MESKPKSSFCNSIAHCICFFSQKIKNIKRKNIFIFKLLIDVGQNIFFFLLVNILNRGCFLSVPLELDFGFYYFVLYLSWDVSPLQWNLYASICHFPYSDKYITRLLHSIEKFDKVSLDRCSQFY